MMTKTKKHLAIILMTGAAWQTALTVLAQPPPVPSAHSSQAVPDMMALQQQKTGVILKEEGISDGYTLISTAGMSATYLIDNDGLIVHQWNHDKTTGMSAYIRPNGHLLRSVRRSADEVGDTLQELSWDGDLIWEYRTDQAVQRMHHDLEPLPNGHVLATVWERIPTEEYVAAGRNPDTVPNNEMWLDTIHEIKPTGKSTGEVVWRWSPWDHLIQNFDENRAHYGDPAEHPHRIDVNQLREETGRFNKLSDWLHINAVSYNPERDEIMLSSQAMSEIWIVSKKTGDLVYRWGNPRRYGKGDEKDQILFNQHDANTVSAGYRGAGNILLFNNVSPVAPGQLPHSTVLELKPPLTDSGTWPAVDESGIFPPCEVVWEYAGMPNNAFYSPIYSSAQRLKNGGTLIGIGAPGKIRELDADGKLVWEYGNPTVMGKVKLKKLEKWNALPPPRANAFFRAHKYAPDYPAFTGRDLAPKTMLEEAVSISDTPSPAVP